ncbi:MAG TPA: lysylphosphatidylglycerol synthase transmembrane domain-containing protein [Candidatus Acidoferrum sp.]|jgi:hypothetical protein
MRVASKKIWALVVGILVVGFLVYRSRGMFRLGDFSGAKLWQALRGANPYYLILSIVAIYGCYALRALRWEVFQRNLGPSRFWTIYKITLAGFSSVFLLGRAGEPVRPLLMAREENLPLADTFGIWALERIFDIASMAVIAAVGLSLYAARGASTEKTKSLEAAARTGGTLLFLGVAFAISVLAYLRLHGTALLERRLQGWLETRGWRAKLAGIALGFVRGVQTIRTWSDLALAALYSGAHWFLVLVIYYWVSQSFGGTLGTIGLGDSTLALAFTLVGSAVQVPGVGGGSQAGTIIAYTAIFGIGNEQAVAVAIVIWLITFAACSLAGVPILIQQGFSLGQLREMAKKEKEMEKAELRTAVAKDLAKNGASSETAARNRESSEEN